MIINRTESYFRLRKTEPADEELKSVSFIRTRLDKLENAITSLRDKLNRNSLPSFTSRRKRQLEIDEMQNQIESEMKATEMDIKNIELDDSKIAKNITNYFLNIYSERLMEFREAQQANIQINEEHTAYENEQMGFSESFMEQEMIHKNMKIKNSIISLTNTLLELKTVLKQQTNMLDKIEIHLDESNHYMERANKEIEQLPKNLASYKDYIIYVLTYILAVLLILTVIRVINERK